MEVLPHDTREFDRLLEQTPDPADEQDDVDELPAGAGLEACNVPDALSRWHWVDLWKRGNHDRLLAGIREAAHRA